MLSSTEQNRPAAAAQPPAETDPEKRRIQRISLPLPVRVEVKIDQGSSWNEVTRLIDVSAFGAGFITKRPIKRGRMVLLTIPMPRQLRSYDFSEPQYRVWANVRRCIAMESRKHGTEFSIGQPLPVKPRPTAISNTRQSSMTSAGATRTATVSGAFKRRT